MNTPASALAPWLQFICAACGYIYNEADGDPDGGLAPGTRFADIPDDWACPLCGVTKADFTPYTPPSLGASRVQSRSSAAPVNAGRVRHQAGVVIVGAGRAGWQMAETLRGIDAAVPITLVTACAGDVYDKPLLSVALARQLTPEQLVRQRGMDAARKLNIRLMARTHAIRVCADTCTLRTTRGALTYRQLVLAHGAEPALPPSLPAALCWRVNHLGMYLQLRAVLGDAATAGQKTVLIVGAGLVGCELANDLALGGYHVTLLDTRAEPLSRWTGQQAGSRLLAAWQALPLRFVGGVTVAGVVKSVNGYRVSTACGQEFNAGQVIAATGLRTPGRLARSACLAWQDGIAVDADTLRTSSPQIYALGDCITVNGQASRYIEPIARQARTVAAALTGQAPVPYEARTAVLRVKTTSLPLTLH